MPSVRPPLDARPGERRLETFRRRPAGPNLGFYEADFPRWRGIYPPTERHLDRLHQQLALAEKDVAHRARLVDAQRERVAGLQRRGAVSIQAKRLLALLEKSQAQEVRHRELVLAQLMVLRRIYTAVTISVERARNQRQTRRFCQNRAAQSYFKSYYFRVRNQP